MTRVYIAYPTSLTLHSANAVQTYHTAGALRALDPAAVVLIPRLPGRPSTFTAIGATHLPRLPFNALNHVVRTTLWSYLERSWFAWLTAAWLAAHGHTGPGTVVYIRDAVGAAWYGLLLRRLLRARLVYEIHDLEQWNPSRARSALAAPLVRLLDAAAIRGSDRVVTLTDDFRAYLARVGLKRPEAVGVVPDAYDAAVYVPGDRAAARAALALPPDAFVAVYSGFTFAYRRVDALVAAWAAVRHAQPSAILCLVGGRPAEVAALRAQAVALGLETSVRCAGVQPPAVVATYLAAADALVIPGTVSGRNASPLKMFEYMAMHRPIVCADLAALREILGDDGACYVPAGDADALARALLGLAADPAAATALAEQAGARAGAYTYAARARAVLTEMDEVMSDG
ncbi:MAG: glycosyltransferase [Chloroflexi bacterium]|nr:glycosyltransferase [Chloroflexota bacterium]